MSSRAESSHQMSLPGPRLSQKQQDPSDFGGIVRCDSLAEQTVKQLSCFAVYRFDVAEILLPDFRGIGHRTEDFSLRVQKCIDNRINNVT